MKFITLFSALAIGSVLGAPAHASVVSFTGNTNAGPTYNRIDVDPNTATPTGLSSTGTAVNYNVYNFSVASSGTYSFTTAGAFDTFSSLYAGSFNPAQPATNARVGNDDLTAGIGTSGFSFDLVSGVNYAYVTSAFLNGQSGYFSTSINGDGTIVPVTIAPGVAADPRVLTFTGDTTGGPGYHRADESLALSTDATNVAYRTFTFQVGSVGSYAFVSNGGYDTFLSLYGGGFDPANPLAHLLGDNDDAFNGSGFLRHVSAFADDLLPGMRYTLVTSAYANGDSGFFSNAIVGPGAVTAAVPEPGALALMLSGAGWMVLASRRKKLPGRA